jgi:NAD(P)-dependent dehydrogenase (short-subunit alcohol dehydrogenase family)
VSSDSANLFDVTGKRVLVTGGARGLGFAMASGFAKQGARVAILDLDGDGAEAAARELSGLGAERTLALTTDVTNEADVAGTFAHVVEEWQGLDVLVNNAGMSILGAAEDTPLDEFRAVYELDVFALFTCSKAAYRVMQPAGRGAIINIASMAGMTVLRPQKHVGYNSAKAAVIMVTKSLAVEWAPSGIRVNAIAPGYMVTPPVVTLREDDPARWEYWMSQVPLGRAGDPEELQGAAIFLASDAASYVTGSIVTVDGGYTCA